MSSSELRQRDQNMSAGFVHLRVHSEYSLSDGLVRLAPLLARAREHQMPAVAITDTANLFAMVKFYKAALAAGIKPIVGVDLWVADTAEDTPARLTLLCQNRDGFRNLCEIVTESYLHGQHRGQALTRSDWITARSDGLIALSGAREGDVGRALNAGEREQAVAAAQRWARAFPDRYYLELTRTERPGEEACVAASVALALELDLPVVASNDTRFLNSEDFDAHEARVCIHEGYTLDDPRRPRRYSPAQYLKSPDEMQALFADLPEALANSVEIARRCNLELTLGDNVLPEFPVPEGHDAASHLREQASEGLDERLTMLYPQAEARAQATERYRARLEHELGVIETMGFPGYFLIVADFIAWARDNGVPVGPGRGSGAGSLVAYSIGITDLDPLAYDLLFERFLNPERVSMPDFDIDFCMEGRDRVIEYVAQRYGETRVSQIITYGTMAARAVIRDVGRVLGHPYGYVDRIAKQVPFALDMTLDKALQDAELADAAAELRQGYEQDEDVRYLVDLARSLEGLSRNAGKHAGGVVIAPCDLNEFTPLYCEPGGGSRVTQFDKDDVEAVGLVKFDFLGLRTLTIIDRAVTIINAQREAAGDAPIDIRALALDDEATYKLLRAGDTAAVFQLESPGMRRLIKQLKPAHFEDIVALVALYRPGPLESGMVEDFNARKNEGAVVHYPHPSLREILEPTYGVILYQEQVMQIARELSGYSLGDADLLRRAMGKKKPEEMARQRATFVDGAVARGVEADTANYIFELIEKFAGYGFNKSHSAAYALLSYQTAWLKTHYPAAFLCAVLSADQAHTEKVVTHIDECQRMGIEVLGPDINHSAYDFTVVDARTIRYGLGAIKGVGRAAIEATLAERDTQGQFEGLHAFCQRIDGGRVNRRVLEALVRAGALDPLGPNRASLMQALPRALAAAEQQHSAVSVGQGDMFGASVAESVAEELAALPEWPDAALLKAERDTLGLYLSGHPIEAWEDELAQFTSGKIAVVTAAAAEQGAGRGNGAGKRDAVLAGLVVELRRMKRGRRVSVILDDRSARIECMLFEEAAERYAHLLAPDALVIVSGSLRFDDYSDGYRITPREVMDLDTARTRYASRILLQLQADAAPDVDRLGDCLAQYHSEDGCGVVLRYRNQQARALLTCNGVRVRACDALLAELRAQLGPQAVGVQYRRVHGN